MRKTIHSILESCNLPTSYLDNLPQASSEYVRSHMEAHHYKTENEMNKYYTRPEDVQDVENDIEDALNAQDSLRYENILNSY